MSEPIRDSVPPPEGIHRRQLLKALSTAGIGSAVFGRAVASLAAEEGAVTADMIRQAEWVAGIELDDEKRRLMLEGMNEMQAEFAQVRAVELDNGVAPALAFSADPLGGTAVAVGSRETVQPLETASSRRPAADEDLAFLPVTELAALIRAGQISSRELTALYLARLEEHDPILRCVITRTDRMR